MAEESIKHIRDEDVPNNWHGRCSGDGYDLHKNTDNDWVYSDNNIPTNDLGVRPCAKCGEYPSKDGDDACIANLGVVMNACCGHGNQKGYIQFDSGIIIRGHFEIDNLEPYSMPYNPKSRQEIFDKISDLKKYSSNKDKIDTLKWVMNIEDDKEDELLEQPDCYKGLDGALRYIADLSEDYDNAQSVKTLKLLIDEIKEKAISTLVNINN